MRLYFTFGSFMRIFYCGFGAINSNMSPDVMLLVGLGLVSLILLIWNVVLARQLKRFRSGWETVIRDVDGVNLEQLVREEVRQNNQIESEIEQMSERLSLVEDRLRASKRYVGLVRYDAFGDVGGSQSFAMAIYDDDGNGAVLTSQVGRADCRVYGKPLFNGKSEQNLTVEEQQAIEKAASPRSRPRINS